MDMSFTKFTHNRVPHMSMTFMITLDDGKLCAFAVPGYMTAGDQLAQRVSDAYDIQNSIRHMRGKFGQELQRTFSHGELWDMIGAEWKK